MPKPEKYKFNHQQIVAWGDMDAYGHLNNVMFARYFENARAEFFTRKGLWKNPSRIEGGAPVLTRLAIEFRRQVKFPAKLDVTIEIISVNSRGFVMPCSIWNEAGDCAATASAAFIWFDFISGKPGRMTEELIQQLNNEKNN